MGPAPWQGDLDPGIHAIDARGDTTVSTPKEIDVARKQTYEVPLELHTQAGTVAINVDVPDAEISIDGQLIARGVYEGKVAAGTHEVSVVKTGFTPYRQSFIVHDGERVVENLALQREQPLVAAAPPHDWHGSYGQLSLVGLFPMSPQNDVATGVAAPGVPVSTSNALGGGMSFRVGYSFGYVGIETAFVLGYETSQAQLAFANPANFTFNTFGGTAALGARFQPEIQGVRPTVGLAMGASFKFNNWNSSQSPTRRAARTSTATASTSRRRSSPTRGSSSARHPARASTSARS